MSNVEKDIKMQFITTDSVPHILQNSKLNWMKSLCKLGKTGKKTVDNTKVASKHRQ
jgi:hypothetical protein